MSSEFNYFLNFVVQHPSSCYIHFQLVKSPKADSVAAFSNEFEFFSCSLLSQSMPGFEMSGNKSLEIVDLQVDQALFKCLFLLELSSPGLEDFGFEGVVLCVFSLTLVVVVAGHPEDINAVVPLL